VKHCGCLPPAGSTAACLALVALLFAASAGATPLERTWYTLQIEGQRVGFAYRDRERSAQTSIERRVLRVEVTQLRRRSVIERRIEVARDLQGRPVRMAAYSATGTERRSWQASFAADMSALTLRTARRGTVSTIELPPHTLLPDRVDATLSQLGPPSGDATIWYFDPLRAAAVSLRTQLIENIAADEGLAHLRGVIAENDARPLDWWLDSRGEIVRFEEPFFGTRLTWRTCFADCDRAVDSPYDPMARLVVRSPYRIPSRALAGPIRYLITTTAGRTPQLVSTPEQAVSHAGNGAAVVTICHDCGDFEWRTIDRPERFRDPNPWVESTHADIVALARRSAGANRDVTARMGALAAAVRARMTGPVEYLGYATALEALRQRSGDCTEYALLLTALARAVDIPTRVVIGLVYADRFSGKKDVFSPHSWVQAWDGERWRSFDAALDGFDATHIALAIGNGDPRQFSDAFAQLAHWRIEKLGLVTKAAD